MRELEEAIARCVKPTIAHAKLFVAGKNTDDLPPSLLRSDVPTSKLRTLVSGLAIAANQACND